MATSGVGVRELPEAHTFDFIGARARWVYVRTLHIRAYRLVQIRNIVWPVRRRYHVGRRRSWWENSGRR